MEKILKALANRRRLAILRYLKNRNEATVKDIAEEIRLSFKSTSKHLIILRGAEIIERDQRSLQMFYFLTDSQKPAAKAVIKLL